MGTIDTTIELYIDGVDARTQYKMRPLGNFRSEIMKIARAKTPITNENSSSDGKQIASSTLKRDSTTRSLQFGIFTEVAEEYYTKYIALQSALFASSTITMRVKNSHIDITLHLTYEDMTSLTDFNGSWGSFVIRFNEPNPANRTTVITTVQ